MKTYSEAKIYQYTVYVNDESGKVHHAVDNNADEYDIKTLYPYDACKTGGWDNAVDCYTVEQLRRKIKNGTAIFR